MDADRWQRLDDLFQAAIACAGEERRALLNEACAGDDGLRHELDRLVRAHERSRGFLETPIAAEALRILASADAKSSARSTLTERARNSGGPIVSLCAVSWARAVGRELDGDD